MAILPCTLGVQLRALSEAKYSGISLMQEIWNNGLFCLARVFKMKLTREKVQKELGYLECRNGWLELIWDCHKKLKKLDPDYHIDQIKEKFGGLRYYAGGNFGQEGFDIISEAEAKSFTVCEVCGKPGKLSHRGFWLQTLCLECFNKTTDAISREEGTSRYDFNLMDEEI
jgi:hypothetical protein